MVEVPEQRQMIRQPAGWYKAINATVIGDVTIGERSSAWFYVLVRGDVAPITIGEYTNLQDGVIVHCETGLPNRIGSYCTVGHRALLHGVEIGDRALIGMGAIVLSRSKIGEDAVVAAGAVVKEGFEVPAGTLVAGVPAKVLRELSETELAALKGSGERYAQLAQAWAENDVVTPDLIRALDDASGLGPFRTDKYR